MARETIDTANPCAWDGAAAWFERDLLTLEEQVMEDKTIDHQYAISPLPEALQIRCKTLNDWWDYHVVRHAEAVAALPFFVQPNREEYHKKYNRDLEADAADYVPIEDVQAAVDAGRPVPEPRRDRSVGGRGGDQSVGNQGGGQTTVSQGGDTTQGHMARWNDKIAAVGLLDLEQGHDGVSWQSNVTFETLKLCLETLFDQICYNVTGEWRAQQLGQGDGDDSGSVDAGSDG